MSDLNVKGLADLQKFLDQLPAKMEANVMRGALRAGMKLVKDDAYARCPVGPASTEGARIYGLHRGSLRDSIRITTKLKKGVVTASVKAGGKTAKGGDVFYAHMIEFTGAISHVIKAKPGRMLKVGTLYVKAITHPGMKARPFLRPALASQAQNAIRAAAEYIKSRLATKHGIDTAGINVEIES